MSEKYMYAIRHKGDWKPWSDYYGALDRLIGDLGKFFDPSVDELVKRPWYSWSGLWGPMGVISWAVRRKEDGYVLRFGYQTLNKLREDAAEFLDDKHEVVWVLKEDGEFLSPWQPLGWMPTPLKNESKKMTEYVYAIRSLGDELPWSEYFDTLEELYEEHYEDMGEEDQVVRAVNGSWAERGRLSPWEPVESDNLLSVKLEESDHQDETTELIKRLNEGVLALEGSDEINPAHYKRFPVEVIDIAENLPYNLGNVVKYVTRAGHKPGADELTDLGKALWYLEREIKRIENSSKSVLH